MKKVTILTIVLLFSIKLYAQKYKGTVYFKDGTKTNGFIKVINDDILFKTNKKERRVIYNSSQVDSLFFLDKVIRKFEYIKIRSNDSPILAYVKINANLKLYKVVRRETTTKVVFKTRINNQLKSESYPTENLSEQKTAAFFLKRKNEKFASHFASFRTDKYKDESTFKETIRKYFKNCKGIIEKVKNKKFKKKDYLKIVEYYNKKCQ
jgi:hypothetical protein